MPNIKHFCENWTFISVQELLLLSVYLTQREETLQCLIVTHGDTIEYLWVLLLSWSSLDSYLWWIFTHIKFCSYSLHIGSYLHWTLTHIDVLSWPSNIVSYIQMIYIQWMVSSYGSNNKGILFDSLLGDNSRW